MSKTTGKRKHTGWAHNGLAEWIEGDTAFLSVVFSWRLHDAYQRAVWLRQEGYHVRAGGPAVLLQPRALAGVAECNGFGIAALPRHNPNATFTSRGCIRKCAFCAVPRIEGELVELPTWERKPIVCDNNLLACSRTHFDKVIDSLKGVGGVDFNQGLDARLLTPHHAERLAELDLACVRLAWDHTSEEPSFRAAFDLLRAARIPASMIRVYVLIGWHDTPADALYRLRAVRDCGALPNPMRYQPLDSCTKNQYVGPAWTKRELTRYMRYWSNLIHLRGVPFAEFDIEPAAVAAQEE